MSLTWTYSAFLVGLQPQLVTVEVSIQPGIPGLQIVGLANRTVTEAKQRISAALQNSGIRLKAWRTVVNLAPAHLPKTGTGFDLAIAACLLQLQGQLAANLQNTLLVGELALDGGVHNVPGLLAMATQAKQQGIKQIICAVAMAQELVGLTDLKIWSIAKLTDLCANRVNSDLRTNFAQRILPPLATFAPSQMVDFSQIAGQIVTKRALTISAAGGHHLLMIGPPGCGKTLLAQTLLGLLPPLTPLEKMEVTQIYSSCGLNRNQVWSVRPFRSPHHTISLVGLVGGGSRGLPGEITLAHQGILFLDELAEFGSTQLEALRQPLETGAVVLVKANFAQTLPAKCLLIAATNPCQCGWKDSAVKICQCSQYQLMKHAQRLSGSLLDRFDLIVRLEPPSQVELDLTVQSKAAITDFAVIKAAVLKVRQNFTPLANQLGLDEVEKLYLEPKAKELLITAREKFKFSARVYHKLIKVALTISRLAEAKTITFGHMAEALQYRPVI